MDRKYEVRNLMFRTEMARKRQLHPVWARMGLSTGQPRVLSQLQIKDRITQRELADACSIEPATLSRALDRLEDMGYLTRKENPNCRRSYLVVLTEEGREIVEQVHQVFQDVEERMMRGFSEKEIELLYGLMERIYKNLS